ncbi:hypothetical protein GGR50DRAFT_120202 [Xylaria sp. CBS 124048]|nr:hypothetical protein GGR50DRAFT_120202 [Xylaria sp. CBS 124048]
MSTIATRSVSPGAALLRSSRMFSMPAPIPGSPGDYSSATNHHSATATIPYPTHLTITTPSTSRAVGDWGVKRPLPLKTTLKQTFPLVRIRQVDSTEHVTDFQSASDHTMTLRKFQELNLPISVPSLRKSDVPISLQYPVSVFEEDRDVTAIKPDQVDNLMSRRWKFKGPWLAGMTDGEFNKWLMVNVRPRRPEFHAFLRGFFAKELTEQQTQEALQNQQAVPPAVEADQITDAQFIKQLRDLREERFTLYRLVGQFLDLAPLSNEMDLLDTVKAGRTVGIDKPNPYSTYGPPITHPSAGLSYLRTPSFIENHPFYGPQRYRALVKGRVLRPKLGTPGLQTAVVGLAGFVVERAVDLKVYGRSSGSARVRALSNLDVETRGGGKLYFMPEFATVDSRGRIRITVSDPAKLVCELVAKEMVGENEDDLYGDAIQGKAIIDQKPTYDFGGIVYNESKTQYNSKTIRVYGSKENYGLDVNGGRDF